jgi:hypothetical protein
MKKHMWMRPLTERHLAMLQSMDVPIVPPVSKTLACGYVGIGGLAAVMYVLQCKLARVRFSQLAVPRAVAALLSLQANCWCADVLQLQSAALLYIGALKLRKQYRAERCSDANCSDSFFCSVMFAIVSRYWW